MHTHTSTRLHTHQKGGGVGELASSPGASDAADVAELHAQVAEEAAEIQPASVDVDAGAPGAAASVDAGALSPAAALGSNGPGPLTPTPVTPVAVVPMPDTNYSSLSVLIAAAKAGAVFDSAASLPDAEQSDLASSKEVSKKFRHLLKKLPLKYGFKSSGNVISLIELESLVENMMDADTVGELAELTKTATEGHGNLKAFTDALSECAKKLKTAYANATRAHLRKKTDTSAAVADENKKILAQKKAAAEVIRTMEQAVPNIHKFDKFKKVRSGPIGELEDADEPFIFSDVAEFGNRKWRTDPKLQLMFGNFGSSYKRTATYKQEGWVLEPVPKDDGRAEVTSLFDSCPFLPEAARFDTDTIEDKAVKAVVTTPWSWGTNPTLKTAGFLRNSLAQVKLVASGKVRHLIVKTSKLPGDLRTGESMEDICKKIGQCSDDRITEFTEQGIILEAVVEPWQMVYIPTGSIVFEEVLSGNLVFGVRRALLVRTAAAHAQYNTCVEMFTQMGKGTGKMDVVVGLLKPS